MFLAVLSGESWRKRLVGGGDIDPWLVAKVQDLLPFMPREVRANHRPLLESLKLDVLSDTPTVALTFAARGWVTAAANEGLTTPSVGETPVESSASFPPSQEPEALTYPSVLDSPPETPDRSCHLPLRVYLADIRQLPARPLAWRHLRGARLRWLLRSCPLQRPARCIVHHPQVLLWLSPGPPSGLHRLLRLCTWMPESSMRRCANCATIPSS